MAAGGWAAAWQLAELANANGDVATGAAIMDGCVTEFGMNDAELHRHRQSTRAAATARDQATTPEHEGHLGGLKTRSRRPLLGQLRVADLPPIDPNGVNALSGRCWPDPDLGRVFKPTFPKHLQDLNGKTISLGGFMQPLGDDAELSSFMLIEYPVGCWYCEVPEMTALVFVELPRNKKASLTRSLVKITGTLQPECDRHGNFYIRLRRPR